ncbi:MAG: DNA primase, partial [Muribaculaceae bacterium]|nr:DNA primase [Muribaculaceae bacterium]
MKKIDRETVQRILDTADIVDVVSDFVSLKRRGANYIGLCPFHNERTPSFSVSKAKGICKCFSCGKGGSPVNFIMELEQLSYQEALRYLAKKYNIEIVEHEMSEQERQEESQRESMLAVNAFALQHFESNLADTPDGREIGLAYFRQRGINDAMIAKFHLGYAIEHGNTLLNEALAKGYNEKYLIETGLCIRSERGTVYDRFKGRVIYPVHSVSGKVVAFGGRTLRSDKSMAKYVNSPESIIYSKSRELYGLYQAKQSIAKKNKCILVEGYMDVISMHQSGVENVVASSGTSLTEGQIRLIHRFTDNITVIYDSDAAGIKASLRGIDMILAEGINVKVLSLPDGDDPDSFAQSHSAQELEDYLAANETDFIRFKTNILLKDAAGDPIARSRVITDILRTIAVIPDAVTRTVYLAECSRAFEIDEQVLMLQLSKLIAERNENIERQSRQSEARNSIADIQQSDPQTTTEPNASTSQALATPQKKTPILEGKEKFLEPFERELLRFVLKYGMVDLCEAEDENGEPTTLKTVDYINYELMKEDIRFSVPLFHRTFNQVVALSGGSWSADHQACIKRLNEQRAADEKRISEEIGSQSLSVSEIKAKEIAMQAQLESDYNTRLTDFAEHYVEQRLCSSPDDEVRLLATELVSERHKLSKIHSKFSKIETERDRLIELVPRAVYELLYGILLYEIKETEQQ